MIVLLRISLALVLVPSFCLGNAPQDLPILSAVKLKRPNILVILTDDQAPFSLGAYGNTQSTTPNIDRLAKMGMRFDAAYQMGAFQGAVCTASRHMIMSGRTVWHIPGSRSRQSVIDQMAAGNSAAENRRNAANPNIPRGLEKNTIGAVFNRAGYDTMRTCKRGNSYLAANKQFTIVKEASCRGGEKEKGSDWHGDQVLAFLSEREKQAKTSGSASKPFMIYFGLSHPHDPRNADPEILAKYGAVNQLTETSKLNAQLPKLPVNYLPKHPFHHGHPDLRDEVAVQGVRKKRDELTIRNEKGREYACIEGIDVQIGRVMSKLESIGELDNTYIIFTSDHGIAIGRHGLMGKQNLYEHSWRVPYIVAGPGIAANSTSTGNIYLLDTLATICDLAGIEIPTTNEGISFKPVLKGKKDRIRDVLYGCYCGGTKPGMRSIRKGDWKLIRYETLDGKIKETQLFNLRENPNELLIEHHAIELVRLTGNQPTAMQRNLADDQAFAEKRKEMEALLRREMEILDDPYRFDEGYINRPLKQKRKNRLRNKNAKSDSK